MNSRAVALLIAEFARRRRVRGIQWGRIIRSTTDEAPGFFHEISYGASKYALASYTRAAAEELGKDGITANVVLDPARTTEPLEIWPVVLHRHGVSRLPLEYLPDEKSQKMRHHLVFGPGMGYALSGAVSRSMRLCVLV